MSLYLILNIASLTIPLIYSFEKKMHFIRWWKEVFLSIFITAILFLIWDVIFTKNGVWGFNPTYLSGIDIVNLPLEEWLFFFCIPYASIFIHYSFKYFLPNKKLSRPVTKITTILLIIILTPIVILNTDKAYTFYNFLLLILVLAYSLFSSEKELSTFYYTFLIILIPFFIINGILTGSFIDEQVVWYNNAENLGVRIGTVPIEDIGYAFSMLFISIIMIEKFKIRFNK